MTKIINSKGKVWYGIHFYSGIAQYQEQDSEPYRVFLNEDTLRTMDATFAGRPVFLEHVEEVESNLNELRKEADGWVIDSFYNHADGKHWVRFITVTDRAENAIKNGMRLSNAYIPKSFAQGGLWNGVPYQKEITSGEYEHLAIVKNPRYEESVIKTPEEFKKYNEDKMVELKKLTNSKDNGKQAKSKEIKMKFSFFKRTKVENGIEPDMELILPKSGKAITIESLVNAYEATCNENGHSMADMGHLVKMHDGSYMNLKDMMNKYKSMCDDMEEMKAPKKDEKEKELDLDVSEKGVDVEGDLNKNEPDSEHDMSQHEEEVAKVEHKEELKDDLEKNPQKVVHDDESEDQAAKKKALQLAEHEDKELEEAKTKNKKKNEAQLKADRLKNAQEVALRKQLEEQPEVVELSYDRVMRGQERYGSGRR